jgi:hypothetical protein
VLLDHRKFSSRYVSFLPMTVGGTLVGQDFVRRDGQDAFGKQRVGKLVYKRAAFVVACADSPLTSLIHGIVFQTRGNAYAGYV